MKLAPFKDRRQIRRYVVNRHLQVEFVWSTSGGEIRLGGENSDPRNGT